MIFVTGDLHGDVERFKNPEIKKLRKGDTLIICGDFGFIWTGDKKEQKILKWIGKHKFNVLFVEGCHDNYDLLNGYETSEWNGGNVRRISGNLMQLCRGELFEIEGKKVFAFGGGDSDDHDERIENELWWKEEQPTTQQIQSAADKLTQEDYKVDYIVTHDAPAKLKGFINIEDNDCSYINSFFDLIAQNCEFSMWYFGKYHVDKIVPPRYRAVFRDIVRTEPKSKDKRKSK
ncbi:MAG: hypothetical protein K0R90_506 [Oscillospiraceae bacterium]|jgi:predicted phosphodiesterase|nr:hypothetical protein [Oscillospiraceae bacterium]